MEFVEESNGQFKVVDEMMDPIEKLSDEMETVNGFCYLRVGLNFVGGCEVAVTARLRIGRVKFRKCGEFVVDRDSCIGAAELLL